MLSVSTERLNSLKFRQPLRESMASCHSSSLTRKLAARSSNRFQKCIIALAALFLSACGCDLVGCIDGLIVGFAREPQSPWKVELFVDGASQPAPSTASCPGPGPCNTGVVFNSAATRAVVRVTTPAGVKDTEYTAIRYVKTPRGTGCTACRGQAQVVAEVP
jgi:hypothetical protein